MNYRQIKCWLLLPQILIELLLCKIFNFVPGIWFKYKSYAAIIDTNTSFNNGHGDLLKDKPIKISIQDITNKKIRKTLKFLSIFGKWNIYTFDRISNNRKPIYITKDELKKDDRFFGERISDSNVDDLYTYKNIRKLKKSGKTIDQLEPQYWVIVAKYSDNHKKMTEERQNRYNSRTKKDLEKLVDYCIKEDNILGRSNSITNEWNNDPVAFKVVRANRIDLFQKLITACDDEDLKEMINVVIDYDGWEAPNKYKDSNGYKTLLNQAKSDEMKELIKKYLTD
jgi:hypothetical protein